MPELTSPGPSAAHVAERSAAGLADQLSSLQALLVMSMLTAERGDEGKILRLVSTAVPYLGGCRLIGIYLEEHGWYESGSDEADDGGRLRDQLALAAPTGAPVVVGGWAWSWAFSLRSLEETLGYLVVAAHRAPSPTQQFVLRTLGRHAGVALAGARARRQERATASALRADNKALTESVTDLRRTRSIHDRLTKVAVAEEGQEGIARAVHELCGLPVAIEDRHGNLVAWAGPGRPQRWEKETPAHRADSLKRLAEGRPVRRKGRLVCLARPRPDVAGVIALIDPEGRSGAGEQAALEQGASVLAIELARAHSVAEAELRLGRDLAEELLAGTADRATHAHASALGYDLCRSHRVAVVWPGAGGDAVAAGFFHAVRRAARDTGSGCLQVAREGAVVVLCVADSDWTSFHDAVERESGLRGCRLAVGGPCERPADLPRSHREARLAQRLQLAAGNRGDPVVLFDRLGLFRILLSIEETAGVEQVVRETLGPLLDYDAARGSALIATLGTYLELGGSYDATAKSLAIHRSTLKYRLKRIAELTGLDLSKPDVRFDFQLAIRAWQSLGALRPAPGP